MTTKQRGMIRLSVIAVVLVSCLWFVEHRLAPVAEAQGMPGPARVPAGVIVAYGGTMAPDGWRFCDGAEVDRTTFSRLFTRIGTTYGDGDGVSTFNLPDLRQRFPLGQAVAGTGSILGEPGGLIDHDHGAGSYAGSAHTHDAGGYSAGDHTHSLTALNGAQDGIGWDAQNGRGVCTVENASVCTSADARIAEAASGGTVSGASASGGGDPVNGTSDTENPPYLVVNYLIKT